MATKAMPERDAQYRVLREEAGLLDRSDRGKLIVRGPEAAGYLGAAHQRRRGARGRAAIAALLDQWAHQADMRVLRLSSGEIWLDVEPQAIPRCSVTFRPIRSARSRIEDVSDRWRSPRCSVGRRDRRHRGAGARARAASRVGRGRVRLAMSARALARSPARRVASSRSLRHA
jgi:hypothetical protein